MTETAKQILYKKCEEKGGCFLSGQVGWIVEAMEEFAAKNEPIISEYQLCPKCQGNGYVQEFLPIMSTSPIKQCDVCNGAKILIKPILNT